MSTAFVTDSRFAAHTMDGHPEYAARLTMIQALLESNDLLERFVQIEPEPVSEAQILAVHTPDYLDRIKETAQLTEPTMLGIDTYVTRITRKYLRPVDGVILEGGCGDAVHVAALAASGYRCIGIDSAEQTVSALQSAFPELDVRLGDVRHLDFDDAAFAGYWSIGVIEHFWDGYGPIVQEMSRVVRTGGYLFLTFPYMSPVRRLKARLGLYPRLETDLEPAAFSRGCREPAWGILWPLPGPR